MPIIPGLGERLREARRKSGLSLEELAQMAGTNRRSLYSYEKGLVDTRVGDLKSIAVVLQVSVCWLIEGNSITKDKEKLIDELKTLSESEWQEILGNKINRSNQAGTHDVK